MAKPRTKEKKRKKKVRKRPIASPPESTRPPEGGQVCQQRVATGE